MAIQGVETKCYILALFVRDDDERFLLGSGHYEFKDSQKQFSANTIQNDVVEVQGNDGFLLAGQVRRPGTQSFDGYIGDGTTEKTEVEEYRRKFFGFFRKNHFYRVIYVFPDGSAIQRKRGFLVDDATVQELYQQYPEYHVALNFEDVNYYTYSENEQGEEIYAEEAQIDLSSMLATGGLVWDEYGAVNQGYAWGGETTVSGTEFTVQNDLSLPAPITETRLNGDTYQQTYSGKNLLNLPDSTRSSGGINWVNSNGTSTGSGTATNTSSLCTGNIPFSLPAGTYTFSIQSAIPYETQFNVHDGTSWSTITRIPANSTSKTFNTNKTYTQWRMGVVGWTVGDAINLTVKQPMLEAGSTATDYEPYVGGVPAPNPDYPQDVQTVTGEQTVTVTGKNLIDLETVSRTSNGITGLSDTYTGVTILSGTATAAAAAAMNNNYTIEIKSGQTYTFSANNPVANSNVRLSLYAGGGVYPISFDLNSVNATTTFTANADYMCRPQWRVTSGTTLTDFKIEAMLEAGSTATDFAPYQSQSYPISLGSTELCKIGDYQDYIYKGADGWYLHKATGKIVLDGTETWGGGGYSSGSPDCIYVHTTVIDDELGLLPIQAYGKCSHFTNAGRVIGNSTTGDISQFSVGTTSSTSKLRFLVRKEIATSKEAWETWLGSHNTTVYYALATPTNTQITDATLISQLNALGSAKLMVGENNVLVSATGTNLPAELQIKYYSTVSFEGAGFVWDEGGSGGPTTVQIDSITNVYPIWTVKGPAVNPELSVITTNTTLKYEGSVGANQTLVIDMMNKTAKLNGTSVIGNVTGDWVNFTPGINRVVYITDNADTPPSLIEWQEVVG